MHRYAVVVLFLWSCTTPGPPDQDRSLSGVFGDPQPVTIRGYDGDAMEPFITRDGAWLLFNNSNDPAVNTDLHYAARVDDKTFDYRGTIRGANSRVLDAVASVDHQQTLYFISTRSVSSVTSTIFRGSFRSGDAEAVEQLGEIFSAPAGTLCFDVEVSAPGNELYVACGRFAGGPVPRSADLVLLERDPSGAFRRSPSSEKVLMNINTGALEYAAGVSSDGRELLFTRIVRGEPAIYLSSRPDSATPFGVPERLAATAGYVEGPSLSDDGRVLYFHRRAGGRFVIYRALRQAT